MEGSKARKKIAQLDRGKMKRVLGVLDLFSVGYGDLGSSIYYALGITAMFALGATPIALSDEIAAGDYKTFTDNEMIKGLYSGFEKGCNEAGITIPSGESPTLIDIVNKETKNVNK